MANSILSNTARMAYIKKLSKRISERGGVAAINETFKRLGWREAEQTYLVRTWTNLIHWVDTSKHHAHACNIARMQLTDFNY